MVELQAPCGASRLLWVLKPEPMTPYRDHVLVVSIKLAQALTQSSYQSIYGLVRHALVCRIGPYGIHDLFSAQHLSLALNQQSQ